MQWGWDGLQCGEDVFPGSHAQRTIEILQLPFFLDSLVFWRKVEPPPSGAPWAGTNLGLGRLGSCLGR